MAAEKNSVVKSSDRELLITRIFDAPRALVYQAWTEVEHLSRWSAPQGFTIVHNEGEQRDGHRGGWSQCFDRLDAYLGGQLRH